MGLRVTFAGRLQASVAVGCVLLLVLLAYHGPMFAYLTTIVAGRPSWRSDRSASEVTALPEVGGAQGAGVEARRTRMGHTESMSQLNEEGSGSSVFLSICQDRLRQLPHLHGLSERCRRVLLADVRREEREKRRWRAALARTNQHVHPPTAPETQSQVLVSANQSQALVSPDAQTDGVGADGDAIPIEEHNNDTA